jgi:hypothetical protein
MIPLGVEGGCHSSVRVVLVVLVTVRDTGGAEPEQEMGRAGQVSNNSNHAHKIKIMISYAAV